MAITFIQSKENSTASTVASLTATLTTTATAGDTLIVGCTYDAGSAGTPSCATTGGTGSDSFGAPVTTFDATTPGIRTAVFLLPSCGTGRTGATVTFSGTNPTFSDMCCWEFRGLTSATFDKASSSQGTGTTASSGSTGTLSSAAEAVIAFSAATTAASAYTSPFTSDGVTASTASAYAHQIVAATTAINASDGVSPSGGWVCTCATFMSAAVVASVVVEQSFFDNPPPKRSSEFSQAISIAASLPPTPIFAAAALFDPSRPIKQPDRLQEDFGAPFLTSPPPLTSLFDTIKSRPQTIDNPPILFAPAVAAATFIVEQSFFDTIVPKRPTELTQGPFGGTSPAISVAYFTQSLFDPTKLKQPAISIPDVTPREPFKFFGERWFEVTQIKRTLVEAPPILLATKAVAANIVEQPFFDALPRIKLPDRLGELYPQRFWAPQPYQSLFDPSIKLKVPAGGDWTPTGAVQINTLRYAISDWFAIVRPKQPLVETPLVDYFPFVAAATPAQYVLLVPHYINDGYYPAYTTVTEGVELPLGWPPTLAVEPLNAPAIQNYWNQGPKPMTDAQPYKEFFPFFQTYKRSVYWLPTGIPGQFQLTGNGAALGPRT